MKLIWSLLFVAVLYLLTCFSEAATPVFLQAISSALGSIPMMGFPMSFGTGLTGAKLAVGGKLLYYLGLFGGGSRAKPPGLFPMSQPGSPSGFPNRFPPGGSPFPGGQHGMAGGSFMPPQQQMNSAKAPPDPLVLMQALSQQGINPLQLMQALGAAGIDPAQMLQAMGGGGPGNRAGSTSTVPPQRFQPPNSMQGFPGFPPQGNMAAGMGGPGFPQLNAMPSGFPMGSMAGGTGGFPPRSKPVPGGGGMPQDFSDSLPPSPEHDVREDGDAAGESEDDIESFFSFLKDMDDNKCISRLICDIGSDPDFLGEFTRNIDNIINSLEVTPSGSGAQEYMRVLEIGRNEGGCAERFTECDDDAYEIVKSVAPSVGVPGMGTDA